MSDQFIQSHQCEKLMGDHGRSCEVCGGHGRSVRGPGRSVGGHGRSVSGPGRSVGGLKGGHGRSPGGC